MSQKVFHGVVVKLLTAAQTLDPSVTQPYMPEHLTTLTEAVKYLRRASRVGIAGGILYAGYNREPMMVLDLEDSRLIAITPQECLHLLKASYTSPGRPFPRYATIRSSEPVDDRPTIPCLPPSPSISEGYGYIARAPQHYDIDLIPEDDFEITMVSSSGKEEYIGVRMIDGVACFVWWDGEENCYVAQSFSN